MYESNVFDEIYREYVDQVSRIDLSYVADRLGLIIDGGETIIPLYGIPHRISHMGITGADGRRPSHSVSVLLCKYLLMCPDVEPLESNWVTYKDFKDGAPFVNGFLNNAEKPISRRFSGRLSELKQSCLELSGQPIDVGVASDLTIRFDALPKVPVLMLFNDEDEDFPAQCSLLFESRADKYLDMECLAILCWVLAEWLQKRE